RVFGVPDGEFVPEPGFASRWRCGDVVCSRVADSTVASLSARAREKQPTGDVEIAVAKPLRGSDGRYVVGGWRADRYPASARAEARPDEIIALAGSLGTTLRGAWPPRRRSTDALWRPAAVFDHAMAAAWSGDPSKDLDAGLKYHVERQGEDRFEGHRAEALIAATGLARLRDGIDRVAGDPAETGGARGADAPVAHVDLVHSLRYTEEGTPLLTDVVVEPADPIRGQAIAAVDLLVAHAAGEDLLWRWDLLQGWSRNIVCAMAYRLGVHAIHPDSAASAFAGLRSAAGHVERYARAAHGL
ncbi:hypothetical protein, partial [Dietzia sp.]|uniref:hypothetical protein n=1 Tax=Dietzia sp. TaxID=1871616 RepID=UPI002FDA9025